MKITKNKISEYKKPQEILAKEISELNYGDVIYHEEIEKIVGYSRIKNSRLYNQSVQAAKKILLNVYGKKLESIHGKGYRLVMPGDYVQSSLKHYKRGFNEIQKGNDTLEYAPVNDMDVEEKAIYDRVHDRAVILNAHLQGAICEIKTLAKKSHPLLQENVSVGRR